MPPSNSTASRYSVHLLVLKANASAILLLYSPKCVEGISLLNNSFARSWAPGSAPTTPLLWWFGLVLGLPWTAARADDYFFKRPGCSKKFARPRGSLLSERRVQRSIRANFMLPLDRYPCQGRHHPCVELAARLAR